MNVLSVHVLFKAVLSVHVVFRAVFSVHVVFRAELFRGVLFVQRNVSCCICETGDNFFLARNYRVVFLFI